MLYANTFSFWMCMHLYRILTIRGQRDEIAKTTKDQDIKYNTKRATGM